MGDFLDIVIQVFVEGVPDFIDLIFSRFKRKNRRK